MYKRQGCTLSSAIACGLAMGKSVEESVRTAKTYLTGALASGLDLGKGNGPLDHCFMAVSYTHLDVYKRQTTYFSLISRPLLSADSILSGI